MFQCILRYRQSSVVITQVFLGDEPNVKLKSRDERGLESQPKEL